MHYLVLRVSLLIEWKWWSNRRQPKGEFSVMVAMDGSAMENDWWCVHHSRQMLNDRTQFMTISKMHKTTELNIARSASSIHRVHIWYILLFARSVLYSIQRYFPVQNCKHSTLKRWIKLRTLSCRTEQTTTDIPVENVIVLSFVYVVHLTSVPIHSQVCLCLCICMFDLHSHLDSKQIFEEMQWHS